MDLPLAQLHLSPPLMMLSIFAVNGTAYLHPFLNLPPRHPSTTRPFYTSSKRPTVQRGATGLYTRKVAMATTLYRTL